MHIRATVLSKRIRELPHTISLHPETGSVDMCSPPPMCRAAHSRFDEQGVLSAQLQHLLVCNMGRQ